MANDYTWVNPRKREYGITNGDAEKEQLIRILQQHLKDQGMQIDLYAHYFELSNMQAIPDQGLEKFPVNTSIEVALNEAGKEYYQGPVVRKFYYHRQNLSKHLPIYVENYSQLFSPNVMGSIEKKDILSDPKKILVLLKHFLNIHEDSIESFTVKDNVIKVKFKEDSLLYQPDSDFNVSLIDIPGEPVIVDKDNTLSSENEIVEYGGYRVRMLGDEVVPGNIVIWVKTAKIRKKDGSIIEVESKPFAGSDKTLQQDSEGTYNLTEHMVVGQNGVFIPGFYFVAEQIKLRMAGDDKFFWDYLQNKHNLADKRTPGKERLYKKAELLEKKIVYDNDLDSSITGNHVYHIEYKIKVTPEKGTPIYEKVAHSPKYSLPFKLQESEHDLFKEVVVGEPTNDGEIDIYAPFPIYQQNDNPIQKNNSQYTYVNLYIQRRGIEFPNSWMDTKDLYLYQIVCTRIFDPSKVVTNLKDYLDNRELFRGKNGGYFYRSKWNNEYHSTCLPITDDIKEDHYNHTKIKNDELIDVNIYALTVGDDDENNIRFYRLKMGGSGNQSWYVYDSKTYLLEKYLENGNLVNVDGNGFYYCDVIKIYDAITNEVLFKSRRYIRWSNTKRHEAYRLEDGDSEEYDITFMTDHKLRYPILLNQKPGKNIFLEKTVPDDFIDNPEKYGRLVIDVSSNVEYLVTDKNIDYIYHNKKEFPYKGDISKHDNFISGMDPGYIEGFV